MTRAQFIVDRLLEAEQMVDLYPPFRWPNFSKPGGHGAEEFMAHVRPEHFQACLDKLIALVKLTKQGRVMVPALLWTMKMPFGYGILGAGHFGNSTLGLDEAPPTSKVIDNPAMTPAENLKWRKGL